MLLVASSLKDYAIEASDGRIGSVSDVLFDDENWKIRWLVVYTGGWLTGRKVLIHPSAVSESDRPRKELLVRLTKAQVKNGPDISQDEPVSLQMEAHLYDYYGWNSIWGSSYFGADPVGSPLGTPFVPNPNGAHEIGDIAPNHDGADPHLRSTGSVTDYHVHATDGDIGHLENFLVDDVNWDIRYLIIDTRNWWPGKHVLVSPYAVHEIVWSNSKIRLGVSRSKVKASPRWDPKDVIDAAFEDRLHRHYGWPGHGYRAA